jgi:hypothetical protein
MMLRPSSNMSRVVDGLGSVLAETAFAPFQAPRPMDTRPGSDTLSGNSRDGIANLRKRGDAHRGILTVSGRKLPEQDQVHEQRLDQSASPDRR